MTEPSTDPLLGSVIAGRYRLDRRIATTEISVVYRAEDISGPGVCAIKILHAARDEVAKRCLREAEAMAQVRNPHVVEALDHGLLPSRNVYIAMEYLSGENLGATLDRDGALPWRRAVRIARQVAEAVAATHAQGIIHRDIKPGNCMRITRDDDPDFIKLLDFGISKNVDARFPTLTSGGAVLGTPAYMAPELTATGKPEIASDVYSFGVLLYQLLTGVLPFTGETLVDFYYHHSYTALTPPSQRGAVDLPDELEALVLRTMAKDPAVRDPSMEAIVEVLDGLFATDERPPPLDIQRREPPSVNALSGSNDVETLTSAPALSVDDVDTRERAAEATPAGALDETPGQAEFGDGTPMPYATTMTAMAAGLAGGSRPGHRGFQTPLPMSGLALRGLVLAAMFGLFSVGWTALAPETTQLPQGPPAEGVWVTAPPPLRPLPSRSALGLNGAPEGVEDSPAEAVAQPVAEAPPVAADPVPDPVADPVPDPVPEPIPDPVAEPNPELNDGSGDSSPAPASEPFSGRAAAKRSSRRRAALRRCGEKDGAVGVLKFVVHVDGRGEVSSINIASPSRASASLKRCTLNAISSVQHPPSQDGGSFTMRVDLPAFLPMMGASK